MSDAEDRGRTRRYATPGPRAIHPGIATSETLADCSILAQLLFDRLIAQADDQGRLQGSARRVRAACLPMAESVTADQVEAALAELEAAGAILRYDADQAIVQLASWWRYQRPRRAYPSRLPAPEGWSDRVYGLNRADGDEAADDLPQGAAPGGTTPQSAASPVLSHPVQTPSSPVPSSASGDAPPGATTDLYRVHEDLTGKAPNQAQRRWLDELAGQYGPDRVKRLLLQDPKPRYGMLGRVTEQLRGVPA